jgi:hypothetical protein
MVNYGFIAKNIAGDVIIDGLYRNFSYEQKGSTSLSQGNNNVSITNTLKEGLYGIQPQTGKYFATQGFVKSGSYYTDIRIFSTVAATTVKWILFTEQANVALPDYGMVIYKDDGSTVAFSSAEKYMKIVGIYDGSASVANPGSPESDVSYNDITVSDADNNYFFLQTTNIWSQDVNAPSPPSPPPTRQWSRTWMSGLKKINSTTLRLSTQCRVYDAGPSQGHNYDSDWGSASGDYALIEIEDTS